MVFNSKRRKNMNTEEISKKYNELIEDVKTNDFYTSIDLTNRINVWVCESQGQINPHQHVCKDVDAGVTPFIIQCRVCKGEARSVMYRIHPDFKKRLEVKYEWYRPSLEETLKESPAMIDHILRGGLKMREIKQEEGGLRHG